MDKLPLNPIDLAVIAIVLISGVLAFFRGFVKEVLAIVGWVGAGLATLYLFTAAAPFARRYLSPTLLADAVTAFAIFVVALIILSVISHAIARRVRDSALSALDRSLGFLFGVARGAVLVAIAYLLIAWLVPATEQPQMLRQAKALPLVAEASDLLLRILPPDARDRVRNAVGAAGAKAKDAADAARTLQRVTQPVGGSSSTPDSSGESGYNGSERQSLDNLIRNNQITGGERQMLENVMRNHQVTPDERQAIENMIQNNQVTGDVRRTLQGLIGSQ
jgi:membrane protein required for colicin V production